MGPEVQLVKSPIADPGVVSEILVRSHSFVEIAHEIFSKVILLLWLIQGELVPVTSESKFTKYWLTAKPKLAQEKKLTNSTRTEHSC